MLSTLAHTIATNLAKRAATPRKLEFGRGPRPPVKSAASLHASRGCRGRLWSRFEGQTRLSIDDQELDIQNGLDRFA